MYTQLLGVFSILAALTSVIADDTAPTTTIAPAVTYAVGPDVDVLNQGKLYPGPHTWSLDFGGSYTKEIFEVQLYAPFPDDTEIAWINVGATLPFLVWASMTRHCSVLFLQQVCPVEKVFLCSQ